MIRKFLLGTVAGFALTSAALAQNTVPQIGVNTATIREQTYSASAVGLAPAASATDIFCISGSSSKTIAIRRISISGTAGTLITVPVTLVRRASLNTGGTLATGAALPAASPHLSTNGTATATLASYTANPTINDTSPLYFRAGNATFPVTSAGTVIFPLEWFGGSQVETYTQGFDIPAGSTAQQYCLNLGATSVSSGLLNISITWTER
jgi:hypothetical protein